MIFRHNYGPSLPCSSLGPAVTYSSYQLQHGVTLGAASQCFWPVEFAAATLNTSPHFSALILMMEDDHLSHQLQCKARILADSLYGKSALMISRCQRRQSRAMSGFNPLLQFFATHKPIFCLYARPYFTLLTGPSLIWWWFIFFSHQSLNPLEHNEGTEMILLRGRKLLRDKW